jgi:proton glutamate symport protein
MVIGILIGRFAPAAGKEIKPLGDAFIQMIKIIIVPLVFSVLVIGIAGHGDDIAKVGKLAIKTIIVSKKKCIASMICIYVLFSVF